MGCVLADRWGVTDEEVAARYACDDVVPDPALRAWRGVTVEAPCERVWPWIAQIRLGPYSYDWIDNLGRRSPRTLRGLPEPVPGEPFTTALGGRRGSILSVTPGEQLTARIVGAVMTYASRDKGVSTRLVLKIVTARGRALAPLLSVGDLVMARRQLLNLKRLAEG
jgi:hypothetical protein